MITAVDTNVLLDVFTADPRHGPASRSALSTCGDEGLLVICEVVWAETAAAFPPDHPVSATLLGTGATFTMMGEPAAVMAGRAWSAYRRGGGPRSRILADFLIGAHALHAADRLLTRDRGFYREWFSGLTVLDPSTAT